MTRGNNLARAFTEIVSIDAWHSEFDSKTDSASVHVDLSFLEASLGGEGESQVRFNLALKRAELIFLIPPNEPLKVIQSSVDREAAVEGIQTYIRQHQTDIGNSAEAAISLAKAPKARLSGSAAASKKTKDQVITETTVAVSQFSFKQSKDSDGNYRWEIASDQGKILIGKVWDPVKKPRLSVKKSRSSEIGPTCRVLVRCRKQDLVISNIQIKSGSTNPKKWILNKNAAVSAYISNKISELGFINDNFDEPFVEICLADIIVIEEVM